MDKNRYMYRVTILIVVIMFLLMGIDLPVRAQVYLAFTDEEREYIANAAIIRAVSVDGAAPIQYTDYDGGVRGISKQVLDEISDMTGLAFEYNLYQSLEEANESNPDIFVGMPPNYALEGMVLSKPFLKSQTILFINSSLSSTKLEDKKYAAVKGSALPLGVKEENSIYFDTRAESVDAVETGKADYGYGNAYSLAFYILQNGYKNIVTIPREKEAREYCIGLCKENDILLSIINKAIDAIDEGKMQTIILDVMSKVDRKITFSMLIYTYGNKIFAITSIVFVLLVLGVVYTININKKLRMQNRKSEILSQISNEYLYEYIIKSDRLELSDEYVKLFSTTDKLEEVSNIIKDALLENSLDGNIPTVRIPLVSGEDIIFKSISSNIYDELGEIESIVGKLVDVSDEIAERERLLTKAQIDGLTGLYNAATTKRLISENIEAKKPCETDALIIMDCDNFKTINDTYGHLKGDCVLKRISDGLRSTFRKTDVIGRIGGDEFCIYMKGIPSPDFVHIKCQSLVEQIRRLNPDIEIAVSIGIAFSNDDKAYERLFEKADNALYKAKRRGGSEVIMYHMTR